MNTKLITVAVTAILLSGCATVTRSPSQEVAFISEPAKATVNVKKSAAYDGKTKTHTYANYKSCETPCVMKMKRNGRYQAEFTLPGYITQIVDIVAKNKAEGVVAVLGNVIVGGVVGVVVDGVTGSGLTLVPDPVNVKLEPENKVATETAK